MNTATEHNHPANRLAFPRRLGVAMIAPFLAVTTLVACGTGSERNALPSTAAVQPDTSSHTLASTASVTPSIRTSNPVKTSSEAKPPTTSSSTAAKKLGLLGCSPYFDVSKYTNHQYEVCTAYVANAAEVALQGFYKYGNNRISYLSDAARHHFETRYWDQPRRAIEQRVDAWPKTSGATGNTVEESITVLGVSSSLAADKGYVQTQESWNVTSPQGETLYTEPAQINDVTLCRGTLPGHLLHEWVVVSYTRATNLDCRAFDVSHDLTP